MPYQCPTPTPNPNPNPNPNQAKAAWLAKQEAASYGTGGSAAAAAVPPQVAAAAAAAYAPLPVAEEATRDLSEDINPLDIFDREPPRQPRDLESITTPTPSAGLTPMEEYMQQVAQARASMPAPAYMPPGGAGAGPGRSPGAYSGAAPTRASSEAAASDGAAMYGGASPYAAAGYGGAVDPLTGARKLRSAPEIFFEALVNLGKNPLGWLFGPPSPL